MNVAGMYDGLNAVCFGGLLRPVTIKLVPWVVNETGDRLAGAWLSEQWSVAVDRALLRFPLLFLGTLLHEMVHQWCCQVWGTSGHGRDFLAAGARAVAPLGWPAPQARTASIWPVPVPRQVLEVI